MKSIYQLICSMVLIIGSIIALIFIDYDIEDKTETKYKYLVSIGNSIFSYSYETNQIKDSLDYYVFKLKDNTTVIYNKKEIFKITVRK